MMPEKIFSIVKLVKTKLAQPENLVKQKIEPEKFIGSILEKLHRMVRNEDTGQSPTRLIYGLIRGILN
jgi:hypothetical protein